MGFWFGFWFLCSFFFFFLKDCSSFDFVLVWVFGLDFDFFFLGSEIYVVLETRNHPSDSTRSTDDPNVRLATGPFSVHPT